jgi:hypothetical protein
MSGSKPSAGRGSAARPSPCSQEQAESTSPTRSVQSDTSSGDGLREIVARTGALRLDDPSDAPIPTTGSESAPGTCQTFSSSTRAQTATSTPGVQPSAAPTRDNKGMHARANTGIAMGSQSLLDTPISPELSMQPLTPMNNSLAKPKTEQSPRQMGTSANSGPNDPSFCNRLHTAATISAAQEFSIASSLSTFPNPLQGDPSLFVAPTTFNFNKVAAVEAVPRPTLFDSVHWAPAQPTRARSPSLSPKTKDPRVKYLKDSMWAN